MRNSSETVGQLINRLFPHGFQRKEQFSILFHPNRQQRSDQILEMVKRKPDYTFGIPKLSRKSDTLDRIFALSQKHFLSEEASSFDLVTREIESLGHRFDNETNSVFRLDRIENSDETEEVNVGVDFEKFGLPPFCPFDLFAVSSLLLDRSGAYQHIEPSDEDGHDSIMADENCSGANTRSVKRLLFVNDKDREQWSEVAITWQKIKKDQLHSELPYYCKNNPFSLLRLWTIILLHWDKPVFKKIGKLKKCPKWWAAAYSLMAISDLSSMDAGLIPFDQQAMPDDNIWSELAKQILIVVNQISHGPIDLSDSVKPRQDIEASLDYVESLSIANREMVCVLPKSRTAPMGCTLRSTSLNLALLPGRGVLRAGWFWVLDRDGLDESHLKKSFNALLVPYPYLLFPRNFKPKFSSSPASARWSTFEIDVEPNSQDVSRFVVYILELLQEARRRVGGKINCIVLPELSISRKTLELLIDRLKHLEGDSIDLLCAGVREVPLPLQDSSDAVRSTNAAAMIAFDQRSAPEEQHRVTQIVFHEKHHRWRITGPQIDTYDLSTSLDASRVWWEDHRVINRRLPVIVMPNRWTLSTLICEDLARNEPARRFIEAIGPNLVIALLMDGPQIPQRWPARYATVLADDPGSSVLSVSSFGLVNRANLRIERMRDETKKPSRSFALWRDDRGWTTTVDLDEGSHAVVLSLTEFPVDDYALDGRRNNHGSTSLRLSGVRQVRHPNYDAKLYQSSDNPEGFLPWEPK